MEVIKEKRMAFRRWQEVRRDENRRKQYSKCRMSEKGNQGRQKKWLIEMKEMKEDMRRHKKGSLFKKMRSLTQSRVTLTNIILDDNNRPLHKIEEKPAQWQRHYSECDTAEVSRDEVVSKLQNGKAAGGNKVVAELVKKRGETMVNWLLELIQEVWRTGRVLQDWKDSTLTLLHKKDRKEGTNYWKISLLSLPEKVLVLILLDSLQAVIDPYQRFSVVFEKAVGL